MNNFKKTIGISFFIMTLVVVLQLLTSAVPTLHLGASAATGQDLTNAAGTSLKASVQFLRDNQQVANDAVRTTDTVALNYDWAVPESVAAGDYLEFQLPDGIAAQASSGPLDDFGDFEVTADGKVRLIFNETAASSSDVHGTFHYSQGKLTYTETGSHDFVIPITDGKTETVPIKVVPSTTEQITKSAGTQVGRDENWTINVNMQGQKLQNMWVEENPDAALKYKSVTIHQATVGADGKVTATGDALVEGTDYRVDNGDVHFIGQYADTDATFQLAYVTTFTDKNADFDEQELTNSVRLHYDGNDNPEEAHNTVQVSIKPHADIEKSVDTTANAEQDYQWTVDYNLNGDELPAGTVITDTPDDQQTFVANTLNVSLGTYYYQDQLSAGQQLDSSKDYSIEYTDNNTKMVIKLRRAITQPLVITYKTHVNGTIPAAGLTIKNTVTDNQGHEPGTGTGTIKPEAPSTPSSGLSKQLLSVDQQQKVAHWSIDINPKHATLPDYYVQDTLPAGLTLSQDTLQVVDVDANNAVVPATDYTVTPNADGFKVAFKQDVTKHYQLTYQTSIADNIDQNVKNVADDNYDGHGEAGLNTPKSSDNKLGDYDELTGSFVWTVTVNTAGQNLGTDATVTDPIEAKQVFVTGSTRVYEAAVDASGNLQRGAEVTDQLELEEPDNQNNATLTVHLPANSAKTYIVELRTQPKAVNEADMNYQNTATYNNQGQVETLPANLYWWEPGNGQLFNKTGAVSSDNASQVSWRLTLNQLRVNLHNVVVTDVASANQVVDLGSITIHRAFTNQNYDGGLQDTPDATKDPEFYGLDPSAYTLQLGTDYTVTKSVDPTTGETTTVIHFNKAIDAPYYIDYRSTVFSDKVTDSVINNATITGDEITTAKTVNKTIENFKTAGGTGTGVTGTVTVHKVDASDDTKSLAGAEFSLVPTGLGNVRTGTTDANGQLVFGALKLGTYRLIETRAPAGYQINPDYAGTITDGVATGGKTVTLTADDLDTLETVRDSKTGGAIRLTKTDGVSGRPLAGAEFALYQKGQDQPVQTGLTTDDAGQINVTDLTPGDYYFVETKAPAGYQLATARQNVTVRSQDDQDNPARINVTNMPVGLLPSTGGGGIDVVLAAGLTLGVVGAVMLRKRRDDTV